VGLEPTVRRAPWVLEPADIVMIVLNPVAGDSRVLKTADTLRTAGHRVTMLGKSASRDCSDAVATRVNGLPTILFPEPHMFLRAARTRIASLNWDFAISYMRSAMWHYVKAIGPSIIHTHDMNTIAIGAEMVRRLRAQGDSVKWVHDAHEYVAGHIFGDQSVSSPGEGLEWREMALRHERESVRLPDALITVSPLLADNLARDYDLPVKPAVVLNAPKRVSPDADGRTPSVRTLLRLDAQTPLLIYSGGVTRLRGLHTAVEALADLPGVHLALQTESKGPYMTRLREMARSGGYEDRLHVVPYVAPEQVAAFIRDATAAVHPMTVYGNSDVALPNKLFDYCMAGIPAVVSNCQAMEEFVTTWRVGEVFKAEDTADFVRAVRAVLADRQRYVDAIRDQPDLIDAHCWEAQETVLLDVYKSLGAPPEAQGTLRPAGDEKRLAG
jgi:glycosyltransferase involved in cell wall biosynthesis